MLYEKIFINNSEQFHITVMSDTFIPLIQKLDGETVDFTQTLQALIVKTKNNSYNFPLIFDNNNHIAEIDKTNFNKENSLHITINNKDIASIANSNVKGLSDSLFSRDIQQFIYIDNIGAITFTENIYINNFKVEINDNFKILLNLVQAKLLKIFDNVKDAINIFIENNTNYNAPIKIMFQTNEITLIFITQSLSKVEQFPSIKLRSIADNTCNTHAIIDRKDFEKALNRLMIFDKKFDITVLNYSKLVFYEDYVKLVSIKNNNYEIIYYKDYRNTFKHESIIRFADLQKQLKAISSNELDISYGNSSAIVINGNIKQLIPEIQLVRN